jgi:hypothetical protein
MNSAFHLRLPLLGAALALLSVPALHAQTLNFNVDLNTSGLSAESADAPFNLDFQLNFGNTALLSSSAVLSNFSFTGGTALGSPTLSGSAAGSLTSGVTLTASATSINNEFFQQFSTGTTDIKFNAVITEPGPVVGGPTEFTVAILDNSTGSPAQIFTTAPDTLNLLTLDLADSNTLGNVDTFAGVSSADQNISLSNVVATATVPEPSTTAALIGGAGLLAAFGVRRFRKSATLAA